jgi:hypothetical protein
LIIITNYYARNEQNLAAEAKIHDFENNGANSNTQKWPAHATSGKVIKDDA